jgi:hypothetical protein
VDISCEKAGAAVSAKNHIEWDLADPLDGPLDAYERLYDELQERVRSLFSRIQRDQNAA